MKHTKTQKQAVNRLLRIDQLGYKIDDIGVIFFVWLAKKGYLPYYVDSFLKVNQNYHTSFTIRDMEDFIFYIDDCDNMALFENMYAEWQNFVDQMEDEDRFYIFHSDYFSHDSWDSDYFYN